MTLLHTFLLGLIQGLTEFLPVSSSGHLLLAQHLFGFDDLKQYVFFDLICHVGTLLAILIAFRKTILQIFTGEKKWLGMIFLALLPLVPLVPLVDQMKGIFSDVAYLGFFFLISALLLHAGSRYTLPSKRGGAWHPLVIGCFQALAIVPGISRSGSTISSARLLGWSSEEAVTFSFLLGIPTITAGVLIEGMKTVQSPEILGDISLSGYLVGFITAFLTGWTSLYWLMQLAERGHLGYFAYYLTALGCLSLLLFWV
ncbi:MAG: undecaprenyl-diphosphate phosphatase [Chlamydiia bacterium]|nr:undecaprenyl-diphosphate phosphatase [Chlamydiia bacterium]